VSEGQVVLLNILLVLRITESDILVSVDQELISYH